MNHVTLSHKLPRHHFKHLCLDLSPSCTPCITVTQANMSPFQRFLFVFLFFPKALSHCHTSSHVPISKMCVSLYVLSVSLVPLSHKLQWPHFQDFCLCSCSSQKLCHTVTQAPMSPFPRSLLVFMSFLCTLSHCYTSSRGPISKMCVSLYVLPVSLVPLSHKLQWPHFQDICLCSCPSCTPFHTVTQAPISLFKRSLFRFRFFLYTMSHCHTNSWGPISKICVSL